MELLELIARHGYLATAIVLFLVSAGAPLPASIALLAAGASAHHELNLWVVLLLAWAAAVAGDLLLYMGGRYTGWWLLAGLCRLSLDPEGCIFRSAEYFYRRGAKTLLVAKFIPGLGAMAAPLAGSLNMRPVRFLRLDALGTAIYCAAWTLTGYALSRFLREIANGVVQAGHAFLLLALLFSAGYAVAFLAFTLRARRYRAIERISAVALRQRLQSSGEDRLAVIADVRSHGYYDPGMMRIKNSIRVEPNRLMEEIAALRDFMVPECEIYVYCSCLRDTTSVRVAHMLQQEHCHVRVIQGGMKAWIKAGGEVEPVPEADLRRLPKFD